jgi:hypothetical protein
MSGPCVGTSPRRNASKSNRIGLLLADTGRPGEAEAESRQALAILRDPSRGPPHPHRIPQPAGPGPHEPRRLSVGAGPPGGGGGRISRGPGDRSRLGRCRGRRALGLYDALASRSGEQWYETAWSHSEPAGLAGSAGWSTASDSGPAEAHRAMEALRRAVAMGFRSLAVTRHVRDRNRTRLADQPTKTLDEASRISRTLRGWNEAVSGPESGCYRPGGRASPRPTIQGRRPAGD